MFKAGDKVICVDASGNDILTEGKEYTVAAMCDDGFVEIEEAVDFLGDNGWRPSRFKLVQE